MIKLENKFIGLILGILIMLLTGCDKDFLNTKPLKNQRIPAALEDYQAMLDHTFFNGFPAFLSMIGGEEFTVTQPGWDNFPLGAHYYQKNVYGWADNVFEGAESQDYNVGYNRILICNIVLDGLKQLSGAESDSNYGQVKGTALFHRARYYYNLAQIFSRPYVPENVDDSFGLPVLLTSAITEPSERYTVGDTYNMIVNDLLEASNLLPVDAGLIQRPDKASCYGMLARVFLQMGNFAEAYAYADKSLALKRNLIDFNLINRSASYPFPVNGANNAEILFMESTSSGNLMARTRFDATKELMDTYGEGDLRLETFYLDNTDGRKIFKGSYMGSYTFFIGLAVDEIYLIRAEASAFLNNLDDALADLNHLRKYRIRNDVYEEIKSSDRTEILNFIFAERRRELAFRNRRWEDVRRWNVFMDDKKSLYRTVGESRFELDSSSDKWTWPLPDLAIQLGGYDQNPR